MAIQGADVSFTLSDAESGKTLAHAPDEDANVPQVSFVKYESAGSLIGISGRMNALSDLQAVTGTATTGYLEPRQLPTTALGYDSLGMLVLNAPNLVSSGLDSAPLSEAQQQAIVDWVRGWTVDYMAG